MHSLHEAKTCSDDSLTSSMTFSSSVTFSFSAKFISKQLLPRVEHDVVVLFADILPLEEAKIRELIPAQSAGSASRAAIVRRVTALKQDNYRQLNAAARCLFV